MKFKFALIIAAVFLIAGCSNRKPVDRMNDTELKAFADQLAHKYIIADGHVDLPGRLLDNRFNISTGNYNVLIHTDSGEFDFERAMKGGLTAPFMSIYVAKEYQTHKDFGKERADSMINLVEQIAAHLPDKFALAPMAKDVEANFKVGKISLPMGMENGAPIGNDLINVKYFHDRGIRYITLTHTQDNQICDSSGDTTHTSGGLSPFGKLVVEEMNKVGIMVDISHVDDSTFYQVMKLTKAPCIASHSSCRHFAPTAMRDMTDDMISALGKNGGVMLINFYNSFLDENTRNYSKRIDSLLKANNIKESDPAAKELVSGFRASHPAPVVDVKLVADHVEHAIALAGIDHVGFGSDFDGVGGADNLPEGLKDVSQYPNLIYELLKRGHTEEDIQKLCSGNFLRVWKKVEEVAGVKS
ncbi:MAG: dipeptidase [Bacteroidetes bacterium]|nr:dipeptidase [Bacteroidota bacterium]